MWPGRRIVLSNKIFRCRKINGETSPDGPVEQRPQACRGSHRVPVSGKTGYCGRVPRRLCAIKVSKMEAIHENGDGLSVVGVAAVGHQLSVKMEDASAWPQTNTPTCKNLADALSVGPFAGNLEGVHHRTPRFERLTCRDRWNMFLRGC